MASKDDKRRRRREIEDRNGNDGDLDRRPKVDPDERDEYDEWRRERGRRGRKRKDKAGGRHRRRDEDEY